MMDRIKELLSGQKSTEALKEDELELAAAALLVEAAVMDGTFDDTERQVVLELLMERFALGGADAKQLLSDAEDAIEQSNELYTLARTVKDNFDHDQRIGMIEMLWRVAYAGGVLHDYEANLVRRLAGLLYVSDRDSGEARKRVLDQMPAK